MISKKILLVGLNPAEIDQIQELLSRIKTEEELIAADLEYVTVATVEHALASAFAEDVLLVVVRVDATHKRHERDIRRLRRAFFRPVPLLLLVPAELSRKVKDYLSAGADEYWILPMDETVFPVRLNVLLQLAWGISERGLASWRGEQKLTFGNHNFWDRMLGLVRGMFGFTARKSAAGSEEEAPLLAGNWRKLKRLGFGSFGEVCLVRQEGDQILAVAKIPHDPKLNTKFLREAAILKHLVGHPNAVQLKDVVKEGGKIILIQEYVEGGTLHDLLAEGMTGTVKEKAFLELLDVVVYAHQHNIMHRDIKPENIIISPAGQLKLLDFGTSKDLSRGSVSSTVVGSRPYMAPEQIMGKSRIASDVWALGVILYSLATEFLPFYDENEKQLMDLILEIEPERPRDLEPDIPEELELIILKCLQKDWTERYLNAVELRKDLLEKFPRFGAGGVLPPH